MTSLLIMVLRYFLIYYIQHLGFLLLSLFGDVGGFLQQLVGLFAVLESGGVDLDVKPCAEHGCTCGKRSYSGIAHRRGVAVKGHSLHQFKYLERLAHGAQRYLGGIQRGLLQG